MGQRIASDKFNIKVNGIDYPNCYFMSGSETISILASDARDWSLATSKNKYPNQLIVWGVRPEWVTATWDVIARGMRVTQGTTKITLVGNHRTGANQTVGVGWWAIGN